MPNRPAVVEQLLDASEPEKLEQAWAAFTQEYSRLLMHVVRVVHDDRDEAMDAYAYILEELRANGCSRLRAFDVDAGSKFSTWLVVVARRLCVDLQRRKFGRKREARTELTRQDRLLRLRLGRFAGEDIEVRELAASVVAADEEMCAAELRDALAAALETLSPEDRLLLALRFDGELSAQQIARVMNLPSQFHVYRRLDALTKTLRRLLGGHGIESAVP